MGVQPDCSRRRVGPCCSHSDSAQVSHGPALQGATAKSTARFQVQAGTVALPLSIPHLTTALPCLPPSLAVHSRITGLYLAVLTRGALRKGKGRGCGRGAVMSRDRLRFRIRSKPMLGSTLVHYYRPCELTVPAERPE